MSRSVVWEKFDFKDYIEEKENNHEVDDDYNDDPSSENIKFGVTAIKQTPMGFVPDVKTYAMRTYNLWIAHTNFDITYKEILIGKQAPGVEVIQPVTRYRCMFGFGSQFQSDKVKSEISRLWTKETSDIIEQIKDDASFNNEEVPSDLSSDINIEFANLCKKNNYVGIFILPNGELETILSNDIVEFEKKIFDIYELFIHVGGHLKIN